MGAQERHPGLGQGNSQLRLPPHHFISSQTIWEAQTLLLTHIICNPHSVCFELGCKKVPRTHTHNITLVKVKVSSPHFLPLIGCVDVTAFIPLFQGATNPSYVSGRRQSTPWMSLLDTQSANWKSRAILGYHAQGCITVAQFHDRGAGIRTSDLPITSQPALPVEPQPPSESHLYK